MQEAGGFNYVAGAKTGGWAYEPVNQKGLMPPP
jgi:hypothetical protein